jgi:23S rRNA pseudouridine2605 synthase
VGRRKKPTSPLAARSQKSKPRGKPGKKAKKGGAKAARTSLHGPERLQKLLARAGFGSRRACEEIIREGRVEVDGEVVTEVGRQADHETQTIKVDGNVVRLESLVYYLVNKPRNVLCTSRDPQGRRTVVDLIPHEARRIFSVGRLDHDSKGAVILTNDGALTNMLTHPRYGIEKTYAVRVRGQMSDDSVTRLREGVWLSEGRTLPARVWIVKRRPTETELGVTICEGKNRQVRRMFAKVGHKVLSLTRTRIGPLTLRTLPDGGWRELRRREVEDLVKLARQNAQAPVPASAKGPGRRGTRARSLGKPDPAGDKDTPVGGGDRGKK